VAGRVIAGEGRQRSLAAWSHCRRSLTGDCCPKVLNQSQTS